MRKKFLLMLTLLILALGGSGKLFAADGNVAKVGNTEYATIDEAIAAWTDKTTLTLLADVTLSDVIKLSSTEYHILDLGTYTMTAASGKDAIQYVVNGRSSASYALDIKADANNPGGIIATGKAIVVHEKPKENVPEKDRPITRFYGGVFEATDIVKQYGWERFMFVTFREGVGYSGAKAPYFYFYGGEFNGNISTNRSSVQFHGGTFNGFLNMSVDSSSWAMVEGGKFKYLSNLMGSNLDEKIAQGVNDYKFTIGSAKATYDRGIYVDKDGYYVITSAPITEVSAQYPAVYKTTYGGDDYFYYSAAQEYGMFYEDVDMAIAKHGKDNVEVYVPAVQINGEGYETLAEAIAEVEEDEIILINGTIEESTIQLPSTLKNVTIKAYSNNTRSVEVESGAVLKDMTITSADGNSVHYEGLTFDGITFDNSNVVLTGWRTGEVVYKDITVTNCIFKNIVRANNEAAFHINCDVDEAVDGFTFTNNVIDGVSGTSNSGVYAQLTGNVTFTGNVINNVAFRPYVIQITTDDGVADTFTVKGNTFSGSKAGRAQGLGNNAEGTDNVNIVVSNNIFKGITDAQQICYWNFNAAKTTANLSGNYYDIDILANPGKIYYNSAAANTGDLAAMNVFPIYTALKEDGTIDETSAYTPVALAKIGDKNYYSLQDAINAVQDGQTINLTADITENVTLTEKTGLYYTIDGAGKTMNGTITVYSLSDTNDNRRITVKNINFVDTDDANVDFISSVNTNHYPRLTIEGCTFTGSGNDGDVAVRLKSSHSVVIKDCTGTGLHSFLQNTSGWNLTIEKVTVTDSKSGLALGTVQGVTVKGCNITADGYGIRMDAQYNNNAVIESNTVKAFIPVVVRKAEVDSNITFQGTNTFEESNTDGIWCAIGTSEYETNGTKPTAATGKVKVALDDTGLAAAGIYGNFVPVAMIGEVEYATLEAAFKAATSGCTIDILADVTVDTKWDCRYTGSKFTDPVTINGNGNTIKFTAEIKDNNWNTVFRFEENATVNNLTVDISEANGAQRVITAKKSLNVDGLKIVGSARYGIIFGEGASAADLAATEIVVKNSTLNGTRRAISDNEGGKDVKSVEITGNTLNANACISALESIKFNENTANGEVDLRSYTAENVLSVVAKANTLNGVKNYIYAKTIDAQEGFTTENPPLKVSNKAELDAALAAAKEGNTITLTADIDYGTTQLAITKAITLDLGGKTLTTRNAWGGMSIKNNPTVKNGNIVHASNTAAIKVWNATAFEDLVIDVQGKGDANKTIGGIVLQEGSTTRVGSIKNVTIKGAALTNGIETYNCGDATANVIGSMEDVTIDANGTAMLISAPCGTATNCSFTGDVNAIEISIKGNYSASLNLEACDVVGGVSAHDEFSSNPDIVNNGTLSFTADEATTGASVEDVTLTIARAEAEKVIGVLKDVMDNAKAKVNDTYYLTLTDAIAAAKAGDVVTVFAGTYAMPAMKAGITIVGEGEVVFNGTLSGTLENLTMKNIHIKGSDAQRWAYAKGNLVFENVKFEATGIYALHFDGITAGATLLYKDCTIIGWAALGGSPASCIFEGCTIKGNGSYGVIRTYFNTTIKDCTFDVANVNTTDVYQDGIHAVSGATVTVNNCTNVNGDMKDIVYVADTSKVIVDEVVIKNTVSVTIGEKTNYYMTLAEAIDADAIGSGDVVIELLDNATLDYNARDEYGIEGTTSVTINGNNHTLTLNQKNSDWASIGLVNGELVLNNMTIEKTGYGDTSGAWNTHAIIFSCPLEMTDVTVNNAIAVQAGAILNNVAIKEANGYYGLWINGNGQEVTMNGGSITAKNGGRGIKIADQYIDNPAQVTLNVTETVFETAKKAAVLVSSTAGAKITASNVNIEKVAEDNVNFVWVDEDWAANFGNVEVTGATVAQEGVGYFVAAIKKGNEVQAYYKDLHAAMVAAKAGETVVLIKDVDLAGTEWEPVSFGGTFDGNGKTISNLTINKPGVSNTGFIKSLNGTVKNVTFTNPTVTGGENTAVVAGRAGGSAALAENITINGTIKVETTHSGYARAAAIVGGWAYGNYKNITVDGGDKEYSYIKHTGGGDGRYVAGIVGHADAVNSYEKCTVMNITISGGWLCGGIAGPGPAGKSAIDCSVENINMNADYSGGMFGWYYGAGTIENATIKNVTFTDGSTNNGVVGGYGHNTDATVTNLTFENVQNSDGKPLLDHVASIGDNHYFTLADAVSAATDGQTIELLWKEGKAPIAMNASLYGKSVTITGTAKVDWSKGWLFVGRGGEGNATLTFDGANLTSASDNTSTGIHVSGREKNTDNKYDGTVVINNSTIELDYLINRGTMTLDNEAVLTVKNGFGIAGRPASETENGKDATATITLDNKSKLVVNNHNGMGLGQAANVLEGLGVMNINSGSTFECTQDFLVTDNGTMNVNGGIVTTKVKITNNGVINVSGESTLNIASLEGEEDINFLDGAIINNSTIGGDVFVAGNVTFDGHNTFNMIYDFGTLTDYYGTTAPMKWNVKEGASLTLTEKARYGLGYGDNVTIIGSIDNALTARENLTENERSLFMHGLVAQESKGWNCNSALTVENAYVVIGNNNSFGNKPGNYGGTYTFNIKNSVVDASRITFYEALSTSTFTFDGSDVKMGTFMTNDEDSKFTLKDSKVLSTTTTNGTDEGNYNAGQLILENSSLTYSATLTNKGTIELDTRSTLTAPAISGAGTITIDAANFVIGSGDVQVVYATINVDENNINVINNNYVTAVITETGIVIKENNLEGDGTETNPYIVSSLTELELFRNKVNAGDNYADKCVKLTADVDLSATRSANNWEPIGTTACPFEGTFDGDGNTISNLVVEGGSYVGLFGKTVGATINNVTIKNANVRGTSYVGAIVGMGHTGTINNCHVIGNVQIEGNYMVGGISGQGYAIIYNSSVIATANSGSYVKGVHSADNLEGDNVGGIVGHCGENNTLTANTVKNITVSGTRKVGGIVGIADMSTDIDACVVENVTIETSASQDYADNNINTMSIGALIGQYQNRGSNGTVTNSTVKNVTFNNVNGVTVNDRPISAGPITGGTRGGSDGMLAPTGVTASNNDIYMSTITDWNNMFLMNAVAEIEGVKYYSLQDAFNAGGEVTVISDITLAETATIAAGKTVVLDLNGYTISQEKECTASYEMISNKGKLTIEGNGNISFKDTGAGDPNFGWGSYTLRNEGTLVVENGTIEHLGEQNPGNGQPNRHMYCAIFQYSGSTTINGGTISTPTYRSARLWSGDMTINGGNFVGQLWLQAVDNTSDLTINGGTFTAAGNDGSSVFVSNSSYDVAFAVTGGTFNHKIGANNVEKAGVKGSISGGLFTEAAKNGTDAKLIDARFKFENMPNIEGYYSIIQFAGTQTRELVENWNWFSTYIDSETLLQDLKAELNPNGIQIKGQDGYTQFYSGYGANGAWSPGLTSVIPTKMYMIRTDADVEVELEGNFVEENRKIILNSGWNWIGYPVRESVYVKDAIRNIEPTHGDVIKSQLMSAVYMYGTWFIPASQYGDFYMNPGEGYMYYSNAVQSFDFAYSKETSATTRTSTEPVEYHWIANAAQYPSNMTVIAMLNIDGKSATDNYEIAAFANGECRGSARPVYVDAIDSYVLVMTINGEEVEELTFKYYDVNNGTEYELSNRVNYSSDAILGTADEPYMFFMNTLGIEESTLDMINIYPNPTTTDRAINLQATCDNVEVFNALGVKVAEYQNVDSIDALETAGIYVIRVTINGEVKNCRLVVK